MIPTAPGEAEVQLADPSSARGPSKQLHVDAGFGGRAHAPSQQSCSAWGGGWSRGTAARQGDPTAFLAGVSASRPAPSAEISETPPELGCSPFSCGSQELRGGQGDRGGFLRPGIPRLCVLPARGLHSLGLAL